MPTPLRNLRTGLTSMSRGWYQPGRGGAKWWIVVALMLLALSPLANAQGEVEIELQSFGVGGAWRPGDIVAMQVIVKAGAGVETTNGWIHVEVPNVDGDIGEYGRSFPIQAGAPRPIWLYAPVPDGVGSVLWPIRVFAEDDDGERGRLITDARIGPIEGQGASPHRVSANRVPGTSSMIGVVGNQRGGLGSLTTSGGARSVPIASIEDTQIVGGIDPKSMPDRWIGLRAFEAVVWTNADPAELSDDAAEALAEYVRRGGHLLIVLQQNQSMWQIGTPGRIQADLEQLLPARPLIKQEDVSLEELKPVLAKSRLVLPEAVEKAKVAIHYFGDAQDASLWAGNNYYEPLIAMPDGRVIVAQRAVGFGRVTVVGVELEPRFASFMPQGDVFWNRVLGRRADSPTPTELQNADTAEMRVRAMSTNEVTLGRGDRWAGMIAHSTAAGIGLILAVVLFIAYWVVAGPGAFFALKAYKQVRHSWLAFFAASILFTGVAWVAVSASQTTKTEIRHFTILDKITYGDDRDRDADSPPLLRATGVMSLFSPRYGNTPVQLGEDPTANALGLRNLLMSYDPPEKDIQAFPNPDRFSVDVSRSLDGFAVTTRDTTTLLYLHWMGEMSKEEWGGMIGVQSGSEIAIEKLGTTESALQGQLIHDFPQPLRRVKIMWVKNTRPAPRDYALGVDGLPRDWVQPNKSGALLNTGLVASVTEWVPGAALDLTAAFGDLRPGESAMRRFMKNTHVDNFRSGITMNPRQPTAEEMLEMLTVFQQIQPPTYLRPRPGTIVDESPVLMPRISGRELDLSGWFNRPCIIITGFLDGVTCPVPVYVDGDDEPANSDGGVMVRWIYLLPLDTAMAFEEPEPDEPDTDT